MMEHLVGYITIALWTMFMWPMIRDSMNENVRGLGRQEGESGTSYTFTMVVSGVFWPLFWLSVFYLILRDSIIPWLLTEK